jgi:hypothetical protein
MPHENAFDSLADCGLIGDIDTVALEARIVGFCRIAQGIEFLLFAIRHDYLRAFLLKRETDRAPQSASAARD